MNGWMEVVWERMATAGHYPMSELLLSMSSGSLSHAFFGISPGANHPFSMLSIDPDLALETLRRSMLLIAFRSYCH